jgi:hypothetical protein
MDKNNINLLVYSPTPESGVKYWFKFILFLFVIFYFIYLKKKMCMCKNKFILLVYSLTPELGIRILIQIYFIAT